MTDIRPDTPDDAAAIADLIAEAFREAPHADGNEAAIVEALRRDGALLLSLVAVENGCLVGHIAASPAKVGGATWACIAPLAVLPARQRRGTGAALLAAALGGLRRAGHPGAVLVGDPAFYGRFGFSARPDLTAPGIPAEYVLALPFGADAPGGAIRFHSAFGV